MATVPAARVPARLAAGQVLVVLALAVPGRAGDGPDTAPDPALLHAGPAREARARAAVARAGPLAGAMATGDHLVMARARAAPDARVGKGTPAPLIAPSRLGHRDMSGHNGPQTRGLHQAGLVVPATAANLVGVAATTTAPALPDLGRTPGRAPAPDRAQTDLSDQVVRSGPERPTLMAAGSERQVSLAGIGVLAAAAEVLDRAGLMILGQAGSPGHEELAHHGKVATGPDRHVSRVRVPGRAALAAGRVQKAIAPGENAAAQIARVARAETGGAQAAGMQATELAHARAAGAIGTRGREVHLTTGMAATVVPRRAGTAVTVVPRRVGTAATGARQQASHLVRETQQTVSVSAAVRHAAVTTIRREGLAGAVHARPVHAGLPAAEVTATARPAATGAPRRVATGAQMLAATGRRTGLPASTTRT